MRVMKPRVSLTQFAQSSPLFTLEEVGHRYGKKKLTRSVRNMLYRLKRQGRVRQLTKGVYVGALATASVNRYGVPSKLRKDAVVAFHSALEFHGIANQVFQTVYYLSVRPRKDVAFDGVTYHCVAPPRQLVRAHRLDFQVELSRDRVRVTGRERSIVDCLVFLPYSGGVDELDRSLAMRSEEHTSELQSRLHLVCRLLLEKKKSTRGIPSRSSRPSPPTLARAPNRSRG